LVFHHTFRSYPQSHCCCRSPLAPVTSLALSSAHPFLPTSARLSCAHPLSSAASPPFPTHRNELLARVEAQAAAVREAKTANASKDELQPLIDELLSLKTQYKELTGQDPSGGGGGKKKDKKKKNKKGNAAPAATTSVAEEAAKAVAGGPTEAAVAAAPPANDKGNAKEKAAGKVCGPAHSSPCSGVRR
jgi:hypothetical protein